MSIDKAKYNLVQYISRYAFLVSVCVGLFLALNFYMYYFYFNLPQYERLPPSAKIAVYFESFFLFFTLGFVVSIFFSIAIGWPLYMIAKKLSFVNCWTSSFGGVVVTVTPFILLIYFDWNVPGILTSPGMVILFVLALCGAVSGFVFYMLKNIQKPHQGVKS